MELTRYVAERIRELRTNYGGEGISQEALAKEIKIAANTVSRWETGAYRPSIEDLDLLSRFFGVSTPSSASWNVPWWIAMLVPAPRM